MEPQKSIVLPIVLSILGTAVVVGGGAYYLGVNQSSDQPTTVTTIVPTATVAPMSSPSPVPSSTSTPTTSSDTTANWKTYANAKYGYSLKYPSDWVIAGKEYNSQEGGLTLHSPSTVKAFNNTNATEATSDFIVSYYESPQKLISNGPKESGAKSLLDYLKAEKAKQEIVLDYQEAKIGAYSGYKVEQPNIGGIEFYYLERNGHVYEFKLDSDAAILKQILSTVQITK